MSSKFVRLCGALIVLRSLTNLAKLLQGENAVLVLFGRILHGSEAMLPAALVGTFMLITGIGLWTGARWALAMIVAYSAYVAVNLLGWTVTNPAELERVGARFSTSADPAVLHRTGAAAFLAYCIVALGTTAGPAWILWRERRARLGR